MRVAYLLILAALVFALPTAHADELTQMAQQELVKLGYDVDSTDGTPTTKTIVAISKFQAEHDMEVTGEATPQLIGAMRAASSARAEPAAATAAAATAAEAPASASAAETPAEAATMTPEQQAADLQARQQACLQEKYVAAQEKNKKKRGMMRMLSAVSRAAGMTGSSMGQEISRASAVAYGVNATASDVSAAAKDLGLTEEEVEACRNPGAQPEAPAE